MSDTLGHTAAHVHTKHHYFRGRCASVRALPRRILSLEGTCMSYIRLEWARFTSGMADKPGLVFSKPLKLPLFTLILSQAGNCAFGKRLSAVISLWIITV